MLVVAGSLVRVNVEASGGLKGGVGVGSRDPIGFSKLLTAPPYEWEVKVPDGTSPGMYDLVAFGFASKAVESEPVTIDVEMPEDTRITLEAGDSFLRLLPNGGFAQTVWGMLPDGRMIYLNDSSRIVFRSSDSKVFTVDRHGVVKAAAPGSATETIAYESLTS
jgi:hypothetical protein